MPKSRELEAELLLRLNNCEVCCSFDVAARGGEPMGIVIAHRGHDVGVWSSRGGQLAFRNIASWDVIHYAPDVEHALALTVGMASLSRWWAHANDERLRSFKPSCNRDVACISTSGEVLCFELAKAKKMERASNLSAQMLSAP